MKRKRVVVVLSTPLTAVADELFLSERAHIQTLELLSERFEEVAVAARCRTIAVLAATEHVALIATGARLELVLQDYGVGSPVRSAFAFLFSSTRRQAMTALIRGADLLYVESPSLESILVWSVARRAGVPYIMEMRGDTMMNPSYMRSRLGWPGPLLSIIMQSFFGVFRRGAAGAVFVGERLRSRYAPPGKPSVAVSSVRLPPECPRPPRVGLGPARRLLFVGHLEKVKAIDVILEACHLAGDGLPQDWRLDIVGDGPERGALEARADALGIRDRVHFHRRVPWGEALFAYYNAADLLLMASLTEGNSRTLLEGMSFGLPALSTAVGEAPLLLTQDALVPPGDRVAFANALVRLSKAPTRLAELSRHNVEQTEAYAPSELRRRRAAFFDGFITHGPVAPRAEPHATLRAL
jgi:glycosyltransferase involved in cell wall biosynthesis